MVYTPFRVRLSGMANPITWGSVFVLATLYFTVGYYAVRATQPRHRWGMLVYLVAILGVFVLELRDRGCTVQKCLVNTDIPEFETAEDLACWDADRVKWRIAFLLSSAVFLCLTILGRTKLPLNALILLITFTIYYLWSGFHAYHHMGGLCRRTERI